MYAFISQSIISIKENVLIKYDLFIKRLDSGDLFHILKVGNQLPDA